MTDHSHPLLNRFRYYRLAFFICFWAMQAVFVFWNFTRPSGVNWTILALQSVPLLVFLPGLLRNYYRSYSWVCFLLLFYFIKAVEGVFATTRSVSDGVFLALVVAAFITAMMASRYAQRIFHAPAQSES